MDEAEDAGARAIVLDYLHLMHSAHTLNANGQFSGSQWAELETQARRGLQLKIFRVYWPLVRSEFNGNAAFVGFVDATQGAGTIDRR